MLFLKPDLDFLVKRPSPALLGPLTLRLDAQGGDAPHPTLTSSPKCNHLPSGSELPNLSPGASQNRTENSKEKLKKKKTTTGGCKGVIHISLREALGLPAGF